MNNTADKKIATTPMIQQYLSIKGRHQDSLVLFRLGDFYELFCEDAEIASKELGIVLTKRMDMPMCGIPHHAYEMYLTKLINNGHKVAICEQLETPEEARKRGYKATIRRDVTRVVTKGTLLESSLINDRQSNFLMSIAYHKSGFGIAYADISTGVLKVEQIPHSDLLNNITRINPAEIICSDKLLGDPLLDDSIQRYKSIIHPIPSAKFMVGNLQKKLIDFYGITSSDVFGKIPPECIEAAAIIVEYVSKTHINTQIKLDYPKLIHTNEYVHIDHFTRKSLELNQALNGDKKCTLLYTIDKTVTAQGARLLAEWLANPLFDIEKINKRLDFVDFFFNNRKILEDVRLSLKNLPDIERALSRVYTGKGTPKDLGIIKIALKKIKNLNTLVRSTSALASLDMSIDECDALIAELDKAINDTELPSNANEGNFIKSGYDKELDELRSLIENSTQIIGDLQKRYCAETGILNLKIKHNGVLGYFIETTTNHASRIPYEFIHRQTLASCVRYTTNELCSIANKIYASEGDSKARELFLFNKLTAQINVLYEKIKNASQKVSFIDCVSSLAELAIENKYVKPNIVKENIIEIENGRHPIVESNLLRDGEHFTANDCSINANSIVSIITGPNMGGKSTYIRQNAIIIIMAQIGSFVPASKATIGIVDKIFSRVGANDDISSGKSTFMVEMIETSIILRQATNRSFVILDEIGRGTSTYDGLAIAWAVLEEIHDSIKARTLFATHYHELKKLAEHNQNVRFLTVQVNEQNGNIIFLHKIKDGFADKSYGLHVASLSGFPPNVIKKAEQLLDNIANF